ncbi:MAG TPA: glycosyltransferase family 2 protein [Candidatus Paceibacterota bacterium]
MTEPAGEFFSIVVPAHNESENLLILLPRLNSALNTMHKEYEVLLVDNASTDNTTQVVAEFQKNMPQLRLVPEPALGYGRAVLAGLRASRGSYIGIIRADNQEKAEDLVRMFAATEEGHYNFYKAIRMHRKNDGVRRVIISFFFNTMFRLLFAMRSRDLNATPKVMTRVFYEQAHLESKDWFIDAEMVIKAEKMGMKIGEMKIEYLPRLKGKSMVRLKHIFEFLGNMLAWRARLSYGKLLEK